MSDEPEIIKDEKEICPILSELIGYKLETLDIQRIKYINSHLKKCRYCHVRLEGIQAGFEMYLDSSQL